MGNDIIFDPARMPPRDEDGWAMHPDVDLMLEDRDDDEDQAIDLRKLREAGFEVLVVSFEDDADEELQDAHYMRDEGVAKWEPTPPDGNGWQLVAVYAGEDDEYAMFVRRVTHDR